MHIHFDGPGHDHRHGSGHSHGTLECGHGPEGSGAGSGGPSTGLLLGFAFSANFAFMLIEAAGAWWANSLALLADAGHMLSDVLSLALAWAAHRLAKRASNADYTYGYRRSQVLAALANALSLGAILVFILIEMARRTAAPEPVNASLMLWIALAGLAVNLGSGAALFLRRSESLNIRGAFLHLMGDALGSVAAVAAAVGIQLTGWTPLDPILSLLIAGVLAWSAWGLTRDSLRVLMERAPAGFSTGDLSKALLEVEGVESVHDIHVWQLDDGRPIATVHIVARDGWNGDQPGILARCHAVLRDRFRVDHTTIQVEPAQWTACPTGCR